MDLQSASEDEGTLAYPKSLRQLRRQTVHQRCDRARELAESQGSDDLVTLFSLLDDRSWAVRVEALEALASKRGDLARVAARALLQDPATLPRILAADILGEQGLLVDVPRLTGALHDRDWQVRSSVATALGYLGGEAARRALCSALPRERNEFVLRDLGYALAEMPGEEVRICVTERLSKAKDSFARLGLLCALYRCGEVERLEEYLEFIHSPDFLTRENVVRGLSEFRLSAEYLPRIIPLIEQVAQNDEHRAVRSVATSYLQWLKGGDLAAG